MDEGSLQQASSRAAEIAWARFTEKISNNDSLSDVDLAELSLFHDRRNALLSLLDTKLRLKVVESELGEMLASKDKDSKKMESLTMENVQLHRNIKAWERRLKMVLEAIKENVVSETITENYGDSNSAEGFQGKGTSEVVQTA